MNDDKFTIDDLWIHDETDQIKGQILTRFFDDPKTKKDFMPRPFGVLYSTERPCYEEMLFAQIEHSIDQLGDGDLDAIIAGGTTWEIDRTR